MDTSTTSMRKTKPTYLIMIAKALLALNESEKKSYHSRYKIAQYIRKIYPVSTLYKRYLRRALKFGVTKKYFLQRKESFRLSASGKLGVLHTSPKKATTSTRPTRSARPSTTTTTTTPSVTSQKAARKAARRARRARSQVSRSQVSKAKALANSIPPSTTIKPHKWQYEERPTVFYDYDSKASTLVEGAYKEYVAAPSQWDVRSIHSGEWCYQVDFPNMIQTNIQHENHTSRVIRRVPC